MTAQGRLAENRAFFGWTDKCLGPHADTFPLAECDMSPRRARPVRSNWLGRRSNSFSAGGAEIFNAVIMAPQPLAIALATSAPNRE